MINKGVTDLDQKITQTFFFTDIILVGHIDQVLTFSYTFTKITLTTHLYLDTI